MPSSLVSSAQSKMQSKPVMNRNVPPFLNKLYNMVNEPQSNNLIHWSETGSTFLVHRQQEFTKQVLPRFFKHGNFSSFVRQLNMYGFNKVPHLQQGAIEGSGTDLLEFSNPHFKRDQPDLLLLVTRKKGVRDLADATDNKQTDLQRILDEISAIKKHQMTVSADLKQIQQDNQVLWQETLAARERHQRQQDTIDKILHFLASVFSSINDKKGISRKRPFLLGTAEDDDDDKIRTVSPVKLARTDTSEGQEPSPSDAILDSLISLAGHTSLPPQTQLQPPPPAEEEEEEEQIPALHPGADVTPLLDTSTPGSDSVASSRTLTHPLFFNNDLAATDVFLSCANEAASSPAVVPAPALSLTSKVADHIDSVTSINENIDQLGSNIEALVQELGFGSSGFWDLDNSYLQQLDNTNSV